MPNHRNIPKTKILGALLVASGFLKIGQMSIFLIKILKNEKALAFLSILQLSRTEIHGHFRAICFFFGSFLALVFTFQPGLPANLKNLENLEFCYFKSKTLKTLNFHKNA